MSPWCRIEFDNERKTFQPGQTMVCRAVMDLDEETYIRCISVRFLGMAKTQWTEKGKHKEDAEEYNGYEEYFRVNKDLIGATGGTEINRLIGRHTFPIEYTLGKKLPSSFSGPHGNVIYNVKITLTTIHEETKTVKEEFFVTAPLDLNLYPEVMEARKAEETTKLWFWCCRSGPLSVTLSVPRTGFMPGDRIPYTIDCSNMSRLDIAKMKLLFVENTIYHSANPHFETNIVETALVEIEFPDGVERFGQKTVQGELTIPTEGIPKHLKNCGLIDAEYELAVVAEQAKGQKAIECRLPVTIGTIPFKLSAVTTLHDNKLSSIPYIDAGE